MLRERERERERKKQTVRQAAKERSLVDSSKR